MLHTLTCLRQLRERVRGPGGSRQPKGLRAARGSLRTQRLQRQLQSPKKPRPFPERPSVHRARTCSHNRLLQNT